MNSSAVQNLVRRILAAVKRKRAPACSFTDTTEALLAVAVRFAIEGGHTCKEFNDMAHEMFHTALEVVGTKAETKEEPPGAN